MKNPWGILSGFKHDNRLKCHRGIVSQWTFQVGLNVTVDETWVDVTSRHHDSGIRRALDKVSRAGQLGTGQLAQDRRVRTEHFEQDIWDRTTGTRQLRQFGQD